MSMIPFFPSLRPTVGSSICIDADTPCDEESELREIEKEHVAWLKSIQQTAHDLSPFGKAPPSGPDPDTDDEAGNDDSEDSDSRDEEEEEDEMDAIDANQTPNTNSAATIDTSSPDIFN
ncbi:anaphase-promoting complex subunit 15 [Sitodiplosis mosellana]|uniref:anaphase-promoting complex subunit 15 n=1 Tax=Sitodiplosis mosellana TaxID=263140 RepID=UPI0024444A07|nr:anaphase-promoting complex subunit 15 [Sitodiplosis mosellana]